MTITPRDLVPDASVAIKWYTGESHSAEALRFLGADYEMHVPAFFAAECGNVILNKSLQRGEIPITEARAILGKLFTYPLRIHPVDLLAIPAFDLAVGVGRTKHAIYDFLYLALAIRLDCGYLTADRVFYDAMQPTSHGSRMVRVADPI